VNTSTSLPPLPKQPSCPICVPQRALAFLRVIDDFGCSLKLLGFSDHDVYSWTLTSWSSAIFHHYTNCRVNLSGGTPTGIGECAANVLGAGSTLYPPAAEWPYMKTSYEVRGTLSPEHAAQATEEVTRDGFRSASQSASPTCREPRESTQSATPAYRDWLPR
jgi:hypothetical protein